MVNVTILHKRYTELERSHHNVWDIFNILRNEFGKGKEGQGFRSASGRLFEQIVKEKVNAQLRANSIPVEIIDGKTLQTKYKKIFDYIKCEKPRACSQKKVLLFPDTDLVAISTQTQSCIAFLSCKTSFRERAIPQSIMWQTIVARPYHIVMLDLGAGEGKTELGTCKNPTKSRKLAECLLIGNIYIPEGRPNVDFCKKVRKIEQLPLDLKKELYELVGNKIQPKSMFRPTKTGKLDDYT